MCHKVRSPASQYTKVLVLTNMQFHCTSTNSPHPSPFLTNVSPSPSPDIQLTTFTSPTNAVFAQLFRTSFDHHTTPHSLPLPQTTLPSSPAVFFLILATLFFLKDVFFYVAPDMQAEEGLTRDGIL